MWLLDANGNPSLDATPIPAATSGEFSHVLDTGGQFVSSEWFGPVHAYNHIWVLVETVAAAGTATVVQAHVQCWPDNSPAADALAPGGVSLINWTRFPDIPASETKLPWWRSFYASRGGSDSSASTAVSSGQGVAGIVNNNQLKGVLLANVNNIGTQTGDFFPCGFLRFVFVAAGAAPAHTLRAWVVGTP